MNDLKFLPPTPKRVVVGVIVVVAFFILYATFKHSIEQSGLGGHSFVVTGSAVAPQAMFFKTMGEMPPSYAYGKGGGAPMDVSYETDNVMDIAPIPPINSSAPSGKSKLIKSGNLSLLVENIDNASSEITNIRNKMGGQAGNSSFSEYKEGVRTGDITIWVPAEKFDDTMTAIKALALRVENESVNADDVSAQMVDLNAHLKNLEAAEAQYLVLMKRAEDVSDILKVTKELNNTRAQIESIKGQLDYLSNKIALSSIHISLREEAVPGSVANEWRPITVLKEAVKQTLKDLIDIANLILVMIVRLPILILYLAFWGLIIWVLWKGSKYAYRRLKNISTGV